MHFGHSSSFYILSKRILMKRPRTADKQPDWQTTLEKAIKSIVSIKFSQPVSFDTEVATCSEATGFVIDKSIGLILTNRHVCGMGPFVGDVIFSNHEQVPALCFYRDPVHDFGFLKFDPQALEYLELDEIELMPDLAQIGLDIRVVGNDAGEKLSILQGSISRLNRNTPDYGDLTYNDFNTFYLQAASSTSGGSSGSPVLNIYGQAVGLQAGGHTDAATDFFFPLDRVKRALDEIRAGKSVTRGTIQTRFLHKPFDHVRKLGLNKETESRVRKHNSQEIGMLTVENVVPEGPADQLLEEGDVLVSVNGKIVTSFVPLEALLDTHIGSKLVFHIQRGGQDVTLEIPVQDLEEITPDAFVQVGGATFNDLSYQLARQYSLPCRGVYLTEASGFWTLEGSNKQGTSGLVIDSVDLKPVLNLKEFVNVIRSIPDGKIVPVSYYDIGDVHSKSLGMVAMDRHWFKFCMAKRNDKTGWWDYQDLEQAPQWDIQVTHANLPELDVSLGKPRSILKSVCKVEALMPFKIQGFPKTRTHATGLVVDREQGLVLCSRHCVPHALCEIYLTFAESIVVPARVKSLHPTQNIVLLQFDSNLIGSTPVLSCPMSQIPLSKGNQVTLVGFNLVHRPVVIPTTVTDISTVSIPTSPNPRFRSYNFDAITLDTPLAQQCSSGVLTDAEGCVQGLWLSFLGEKGSNANGYYLGVDVRPFLQDMLSNSALLGLSAEFQILSLSKARHMGLDQEWVNKIEHADKAVRQVLMVRRVEVDSPTAKSLHNLDILLTIEGQLAHQISQVQPKTHLSSMQVQVLRDKQVCDLVIEPTTMPTMTPDHLVFWAGAILTEPHHAVLMQSQTKYSGIYVQSRANGSPAMQYNLFPTVWITHLNQKPVSTLKEFCDIAQQIPDGSYVRLKTITFDGVPTVSAIKLVNHYWPMMQLFRDPHSPKGWKIKS
ncbi:trypsin-like cysteine/serine peptidase domain-containing protein [Gorgonomyces haynaldii]|nr:trypsin-like cysteine/serine peptidase domain-containing protein [Gorgonomyces haynaldii]